MPALFQVVIVLMLTLLTGCGGAVDRTRPGDAEEVTHEDLNMLGIAALEYRMQHGRFPGVDGDLLQEIRAGGGLPLVLARHKSPFLDEWGSPIRWHVATNCLNLVSAAGDRVFGSADDIRIDFCWPADSNQIARAEGWLTRKEPSR